MDTCLYGCMLVWNTIVWTFYVSILFYQLRILLFKLSVLYYIHIYIYTANNIWYVKNRSCKMVFTFNWEYMCRWASRKIQLIIMQNRKMHATAKYVWLMLWLMLTSQRLKQFISYTHLHHLICCTTPNTI